MRSLLFALFAAISAVCSAQITVTGRVMDVKTMEPLPFVALNISGTVQGTLSDIDGRFKLDVPQLPVTLRSSYVGYSPQEILVVDASPVIIRLQRSTTELREMVVRATDNPAHRIIRRAYANRIENDGMRYRPYRYTSYSKTIFTAAVDSAITNDPERRAKLDSNTREIMDFTDQQHIFLIESATKKSFIPPASAKEEVIAMRVSGLKDPALLALVAQTETFSIYEPQITINEKVYLGPLGPSSCAKYRFTLEDTLYQGADSVFVISYRPRKGTKFDGLKGLIYINTDGYAVQNVTAEPVEREGVSIKFQQLHERVPTATGGGKSAWFPVQLNATIYFDNLLINGVALVGIGRTYLKDIQLDADVKRKEVRGPEFVADRIDVRRDEAFWNSLRTDSLDKKELKTYHVIDSLGAAEHLDRKLKILGAITSGRVPIGPFDLLLARVLGYTSNYEGIRLGAGFATNDRITRFASIGGYAGYGFGDKHWKYGGDLTIKPIRGRDFHIMASYANDLDEIGGVKFSGLSQGLNTESYRFFYIDRMEHNERFAGEVMMRVGSSLKVWMGSERTLRVNDIGYQYAQRISDGITRYRNDFLTGAFTLDLRWAFREKLARLPERELALGTKYPIVYLHAMRAVKGLWNGEWETWRVDAMVEKTFHIRLAGNLSVRVLGGIADPDAPMSFLYNLRATNGGKIPIAADNSFQTMRPNEFLADRYVTIHVRHSFGSLLVKSKHFNPKPALVSSAGFGELGHPENHRGVAFSAMGKGFFESGVIIDSIFKSSITAIGGGVFYRYGPYAFAKASDNFVFKFSVSFAL